MVMSALINSGIKRNHLLHHTPSFHLMRDKNYGWCVDPNNYSAVLARTVYEITEGMYAKQTLTYFSLQR